jgi:phospholipase/lecithinase/hemolysin
MISDTTFRRARLLAVLLSIQLGVVAHASAQTGIDAIVTFGTSLSDSGNAFALIKTNATPPDFGMTPEDFLVPSAPYATGGHHLTNGPTWVEQLAKALGVGSSANPAFASRNPHALNYAIGSARAVTDPIKPNQPSLQQEVAAFLSDVGGAAPANALYVIEMGANDVHDALLAQAAGGNPDLVIDAAVQSISTAINVLYAAGARHFLVWDVPALALTPSVQLANAVIPGTQFLTNLLTLEFNSKLAAMLAAKALPGLVIIPLDVYSLMTNVVSSPQAFTLSNVTDACITPNVAPFTCQRPDSYLFWDGVHPTTAGHAIIARAAQAALTTP